MKELPSIFGNIPRNDSEAWRARRTELLALLAEEEYGFSPETPAKVDGEVLSSEETCAGKAVKQNIKLSFETGRGIFSFPVTLLLPKNADRVPMFVFLNFRPNVPDDYLPAEEILDSGYGIARVYYKDVTADGLEQDGIAAYYPSDANTGWGKLAMWAFAASRVTDYLLTRSEIDPSRIGVIGHSRLGKAALWCGAQDERFSVVISNDSGCSGAAISRDKKGESIEAITKQFPFWFCGNYRKWSGKEEEAPFDQHMLLALIAPRYLCVGSAAEDTWADPESEHLGCEAASPAWENLGVTGRIGYHCRPGTHYLSRADWQAYIRFRDAHGC